MAEADWGMVMGIVVLVLGTILAVTLITQVFGTWRARAALAREEAYRQLAQQVAEQQAALAKGMHDTTETVKDMQRRVTSIEKLLSEVG
ncbi:hypothetical protein [Bordetella sp. BOR01]|uniref:hypothetical protein n=1 Tax=Bordetella sp. BOR01 TaxID=2854779 RepID=UPI001C488B33|nr:hypothetical protein [Bordetella sp. BOR01]MBV7485160.1 hypothetical protein [Bordetella sp. BOR01]